MSLETVLRVIFFVVIPLSMVGGFIFYKTIEKAQGTEVAKKYNRTILLTVIASATISFAIYISAQLFSFSLSWTDLLNYWIGAVLLAMLIIFIKLNRWCKSKETLYNLTKWTNNPNTIFVALLIFTIILNIFEFYIIEDEDYYILFRTIIFGLLFAYGLGETFGAVYLTKKGFSRFTREEIRWEQITNYHWQNEKNRRINLINEGTSIATFHVHIRHQEWLDEILQKHLNEQSNLV